MVAAGLKAAGHEFDSGRVQSTAERAVTYMGRRQMILRASLDAELPAVVQ